MPESHQRPFALITGASSGIGEAFADRYAAMGYDLGVVARNPDRLQALASRLEAAHGVTAKAISADLAEAGVETKILSALGGRRVDALVNNAGFGIPRVYLAAPWSLQRDFLMSMAVAPCALAYAVLPAMVQAGAGSIINVASVAGFSPGVAGNTLYPAVKSLIIKFSQALDLEVRARGVRVTALCPGPTRTAFMTRAGVADAGARPSIFSQTPEAVVQAALRGNAAGRAVVIPGVANRVSVFLLRRLPESLVRAAVNAGAARYLLED